MHARYVCGKLIQVVCACMTITSTLLVPQRGCNVPCTWRDWLASIGLRAVDCLKGCESHYAQVHMDASS